eukprot:scaffold674_cov371-Prasinococcus_capsulatus_cf.AAC.4
MTGRHSRPQYTTGNCVRGGDAVNVEVVLIEIREKAAQAPLAALITLGSVLIEGKVLIVLVDGIVCEMHARLAQVCRTGSRVRLGAESSEALTVPEDA